MVCIVLGQGFEEMEAIISGDLLRRAGVEVVYAGIGGREITGGHGITVIADTDIRDVEIKKIEMILLPGGMGGVNSILADEYTLELVRAVNAEGKFVAAICAAPMILAKLGLLDGKKAVCYPGMENELTGAQPIYDKKTMLDGSILTGQGPGSATDFGIEAIRVLKGEEAAQSVLGDIHY